MSSRTDANRSRIDSAERASKRPPSASPTARPRMQPRKRDWTGMPDAMTTSILLSATGRKFGGKGAMLRTAEPLAQHRQQLLAIATQERFSIEPQAGEHLGSMDA